MLLEIFTDEGVGTQVLPGVATKIRKATRRMSHARRPPGALRRRADEHLRPAAAGARPRRGRPRLGRRRQRATSTCSAASPSTRSATPTRPWSRRSPASSATLGHVSNFFATEPQVALAERLLAPARRAGDGKVFFTNSGAEANEAALKLTRRTGRTHLVAAEGAFHGRTMGALALTSKAAYREPFEPLPGDVTFVPYGDAAALAAAVTDETAAVVLEPIQGEAGVVVPPDGYLAAARRITRDARRAAVARRGADRHRPDRRVVRAPAADAGVEPDVVTAGQGPRRRHPDRRLHRRSAARGDLLQPGNHGTTFGGNPVACAAALAVLDTIEDDGLLDRVTELGRAAPRRPRRTTRASPRCAARAC